MSEYRFTINPDNTVSRGRLYRLPDEWTTDAWGHYWEGDHAVGYYDEGFRGRHVLGDSPDSERVLDAINAAENYDGDDLDTVLTKVARRITGRDDSRFIAVSLDRGYDLIVLAWDGDPEHVWRNEIEALNWGDIYRIEVEDYDPTLGWQPADEVCDEWYGEEPAQAAFEREFELAEFPAELFVGVGA